MAITINYPKTIKIFFNLKDAKRHCHKDHKVIKVPNPDKKNKDKIINQILEERKIIEGNKKIIVKFSEKISNTINNIWLN